MEWLCKSWSGYIKVGINERSCFLKCMFPDAFQKIEKKVKVLPGSPNQICWTSWGRQPFNCKWLSVSSNIVNIVFITRPALASFWLDCGVGKFWDLSERLALCVLSLSSVLEFWGETGTSWLTYSTDSYFHDFIFGFFSYQLCYMTNMERQKITAELRNVTDMADISV